MGRMENFDGTTPRSHYHTIGEADPLPLILSQKLIADGPICRLIFAPVGVDLLSDFGGEAVG